MISRLLRVAGIMVLLHVPTAPRAALAAATPTLGERVDRYVAGLPEPFNGTILLAVGDEILLNQGCGLANRSYGIPNSADTRYQIASFTKQITAVLTLKLAQMGLVDLHAPIGKYLPRQRSDDPRERGHRLQKGS